MNMHRVRLVFGLALLALITCVCIEFWFHNIRSSIGSSPTFLGSAQPTAEAVPSDLPSATSTMLPSTKEGQWELTGSFQLQKNHFRIYYPPAFTVEPVMQPSSSSTAIPGLYEIVPTNPNERYHQFSMGIITPDAVKNKDRNTPLWLAVLYPPEIPTSLNDFKEATSWFQGDGIYSKAIPRDTSSIGLRNGSQILRKIYDVHAYDGYIKATVPCPPEECPLGQRAYYLFRNPTDYIILVAGQFNSQPVEREIIDSIFY